jgi:hypothetical protein
MEINDKEVKYKSPDNLDGPTRIVYKSEIFYIKYENGSKEIYGNSLGKKNNTVTIVDSTVFIPEQSKKFGGPRIGFTFITPGTLSDRLAQDGKHPFITQFGWQFETRLFSVDNGPSGIVEFIPIVGGMEQGEFLPSASLLIGLRGAGKRTIEFAVGPNLSASGLGMVFAVGANFKSGNVNFPVNLAFVPSVGNKRNEYDQVTQTNKAIYTQTGYRITLTVGFNLRKK